MPNHIQNRIKVTGDQTEIQKLFDHIKGKYDDGEEMQIDFNKIKPMPAGMHVEVSSRVTMWVEICTGQIDFDYMFRPLEDSVESLLYSHKYKSLTNRLAATNAMEYLTGRRSGNVKDFSDEDFGLFVQCLKNYREHGCTSWYEWSIANWGTKWNAYSQNDKRNTEDTIHFQTAWSSPIKLIQELSKMFPSVEIELTYADEDSGSNTGRLVFKNGEAVEVSQPESQSNEGYEIYFELNPDSVENYELVNGAYQYKEPA